MESNSNTYLVNIVIHHKGDWNKTYESIIHKEHFGTESSVKDDFITILDKSYPERLKQVYKPPFVLFCKGDITLLDNNDLISVGTDKLATIKTENIELLFDRSRTYLITNSVIGCVMVELGYKVILVLDTPMVDSKLTRTITTNGGLVITELPWNSGGEPVVNDFTRILSGLENKLAVMTCSNKSWAIRQVMNSINLGHDVYVVPTEIGSELKNNSLINEGAYLLYNKSQLA